jgi:hypothetical protein
LPMRLSTEPPLLALRKQIYPSSSLKKSTKENRHDNDNNDP